MKVRSWLSSTCSFTAETTSFSTPSSPKHFAVSSDRNSVVSDTTTTSKSPTSSSPASLQSDLSLQTLPSVPSLQHHLSLLETLTLSLSHLSVASLPTTPRRRGLPVTCLAVHNNLLYSAAGHYITVHDHQAGGFSPVDEFNGPDRSSGSIKAVAFGGGRIFTAHQDSKIRVWKFTPAKNRHRFVTSLPTVSDRLRRLALPKSYVAVRRHRKRLWIEHADAVTGLAVDGAGTKIYSVSWDRSLKVWRASDLRCVESVDRAHDDAINAVAVSGNGTVYTGSADCRIRVWAKPEGQRRHALVATLERHRSAVNALALNDEGSVLFSGSCDRSILVWEREDSACHMAVSGALRGHGSAVLSLFNVSDLLLSGSADRTVRIWQRGGDGRYLCLSVLEGHARPVKSLVALEGENGGCGGGEPNGVVTVFSGALDGETKVWQVSVSRHHRK